MRMILNIFFFLWELPQNLLGLCVFLLQRRNILSAEYIKNRYFLKVKVFAISLGFFIFWGDEQAGIIPIRADNKAHEYGHTIQSRIFGPLYLVLVGIPSISRVIYGKIYFNKNKVKWNGYYDGYPEKWADDLGKKYFS